jgi:uncharacterized protein YuzE
MKGTYDPKADAAYLYLSEEKIAKTKVISDSLNFDLDADGKLVGIEFLDAKSQLTGSTLQSFSQI